MTEEKTFEQMLDQKVAEAEATKEFVALDTIPNEIRLKWLSDEFKKDKMGNEALFVIFATEDNRKVKQKYTASMYSTLKESIQAIGTRKDLMQSFVLYRKKAVGKKGSFERLYPVSLVSQETRKGKR